MEEIQANAGAIRTDTIRIGIVGCGAVTERYHLPAAMRVDGCTVTVLIDTDRLRAERLAAKYSVPTISTDIHDLPRCADAAIVAVPHRLHASIGEYLLSVRCHVLMEKPLALTDAECERLVMLADEKNVVLTVGLLRRYFRAPQIAKKLVEAGILGEIKSFDIREGNIYNWPVASDFMFRASESGGGVLVDTGAHTLDFVLWCLGDVESFAYHDDNLGGVETECELHLQMKSGAEGLVELSRLRNLRNTAIITGERGEIEVHLRNDLLFLTPGSRQSYRTLEALPRLRHTLTRNWPDCFPTQIEAWLDAIRNKLPAFITGEAGRKSVALIEACYQQRRRLGQITGIDGTAEPVATPPILKNKVVLVTGATGSIGGRLVEKLVLEHQAEVRVLVRNLANLSRVSRLPVSIHHGDVTDLTAVDKAVKGCDIVFHCAYAFGKSSAEQERVAVDGSRNVAWAVLRHKVKSLVYVSTVSVYEPMQDGDLDEAASKVRSGWTYSDTKKKAEKTMLEFHTRYGLPIAVVQPSIVYGPFVKGWTQGPLNQLKSGTVILPNEGSGLCNAVYIDDVVDALILAATNPKAIGETFLISGAEPVTWYEFYHAYEAMLGMTAIEFMTTRQIEARHKREKYLRNPIGNAGKWLIARSPLARSPRGSGSSGNSAGQREFVPDPQRLALFQSITRVRIDKARRILGYEPRFDLRRGMDCTAKYVQWANSDK